MRTMTKAMAGQDAWVRLGTSTLIWGVGKSIWELTWTAELGGGRLWVGDRLSSWPMAGTSDTWGVGRQILAARGNIASGAGQPGRPRGPSRRRGAAGLLIERPERPHPNRCAARRSWARAPAATAMLLLGGDADMT